MARLARVVVPGMAHHITQRGNHRQTTFFCDDDYHAYLELMAHWCRGKRGQREFCGTSACGPGGVGLAQ